jgi:D-glycero-D-manno-heptose 1,7-bisphosphate phosphatase
MSRSALFLDKDGTLLDDVPYNIEPSCMRFAKGAREALALFAGQTFALFVVSNQAGIALGRFGMAALDAVEQRLHEMVASCGAKLDGVYWCPHHPAGCVPALALRCECRKPAPGMLLQAACDHDLDLPSSWFIGDILDDVEAGNRAGCRTILLDNGNETEWRYGPQRVPFARAADLHGAARIVVREVEGAKRAARPARLPTRVLP